MSSKQSQTPKQKTPKANKKHKKDSSKGRNQDKEEKKTKTPVRVRSSSSSAEEQDQNTTDHQDDCRPDEPEDETDVPDEPATQSFAERLKILNLQTDLSDQLLEPDDSELGSHDGEDTKLADDDDQADEAMGRKMLKAHKQPKQAAGASTNPSNPIASIGSFAQTLTQALRSTDTKLLESCFLQHESKKNKHLIVNTIQRLPKSLLHTLIQQLVMCLNRKKKGHGDGLAVAPVKRTKMLIEWVQQILIVHMSYLLTMPALVTQLTTLHTSLQKRLNLHTKLLSLNGRLDLVLNQIELKKITKERNLQLNGVGSKMANGVNPRKIPYASAPTKKPFQYVEGQSSDSDAQDHPEKEGQSGSDHDDDENEEDGDDGSNSEEEGSVEEVVLGTSGSSGDDSGESDKDEVSQKLGNQFDDLLDLEAEESNSDGHDDEEDSEDDEDEDDDDDESMDGFINDDTEVSQEEDSDSE